MNNDTSSYDLLSYSSKVHPGRHPARFFSLAKLFEMEAVPLKNARILEIGCGTGDALFPLALSLPAAKFFGFDSSHAQIESGKKMAEKLALTNLNLWQGRIEDFDSPESDYDYMICHGVFSWVSKDIQNKILRLCAQYLSKKGLAFVSFNTLPGWHFRRIIRDFLCANVNRTLMPAEQVKEAGELLVLLERSAGYEFERPYSLLLSAELKRIKQESDAYVFHEFLEEENNPLYWSEFQALVDDAKLQCICDAKLSRNGLYRFASSSVESSTLENICQKFPENSAQEEFVDHVYLTPFRESLICHKGTKLKPAADISVLSECYVLASFQPSSGKPDLSAETEEEFIDQAGQVFYCTEPVLKLALIALAKSWPRNLKFSELCQEVASNLSAENISAEDVKGELLKLLGGLIIRDLVDFSFYECAAANTIPSHPMASPFAREQARYSNIVTNLCYESVELGDLERELLQHLNGQTDKDALCHALLEALRQSGAKIQEDGIDVVDAEKQVELVNILVKDGLETLRKAALILNSSTYLEQLN